MPPHRVSVVIPTYNRAPLLARSLASVLNQTTPVYEVIVVDDGSSDGTEAVVREVQGRDPRVRFVAQDHAGAPAARNLGIALASGSLIAFQDSDDVWHPGFIRALTKYHGVSGRVAFCSMRTIRPSGVSVIDFPDEIDDVARLLSVRNCISTQSALLDAHLLKNHRFDERLPRLQDWDLWLGLVGVADFVHHPEVLVDQYLQRDSITSGTESLYAALKMITRKHWRVLMRSPQSFVRLWLASRWRTRGFTVG